MLARYTIAWVLLSATALGADCRYVNTDGTEIVWDTPLGFTVDGRYSCDTYSAGTGIAIRGVHCESGWQGSVFFASSARGGEDLDLMIFHNEVWYRECP